MKYFCLGIKGVGLSSLALILKDLGNDVIGYDDNHEHKFNEDKLIQKGIKIYSGNNNVLTSDMVIIKSTSIKNNHPEVEKAINMGLKIYEYHEFLGELTKQYKTIAISGCHGKTTTSSMLKTIIDNTIGCNYLIGDGNGHAYHKNELFVIEACEHYRHFLAYLPNITVITNIDLDHVSYYKTLDDVKNAFSEFAGQTKDLVVIYGDAEDSRNLKIENKVLYYGLNDNNDVIAKNIVYNEKGISFDVYLKNDFYMHLDLPFFGTHLLLNSLAVITVCHYLKINHEDIKKYLLLFKGADRRFKESVYQSNIIIDDYAHHPKEIEATIEAARQKYPNKNIVAIFEPHTFVRTKAFAYEMAMALNKADVTYVLDICSPDKPEDYPDITSDLIIENLKNGFHLTKDNNLLEEYKDSIIIFMSPIETKMFNIND